jgi:hypothetical protein
LNAKPGGGQRPKARLLAAAALVAVAAVVVALLAGGARRVPPPPPVPLVAPGRKLAALIDDVSAATAVRFGATDSTGAPLGTVKIIPAGPRAAYVGIYHVSHGGQFSVRVAVSHDLLHFSYVATLATNASQPTIARTAQGGFLAAWEKSEAGNRSHLEFAQYGSLADLISGRSQSVFDAPRTLSGENEGTPSFYTGPSGTVSANDALVGFHYYDTAISADRNAVGELFGVKRFVATPATALNGAFPAQVAGNIGGRDEIFFEGAPFTVIEAQTTPRDFGSFHIYLYDDAHNRLAALDIRTPAKSTSFGNPKVTQIVDPRGHRALVVSLFVFGNGAHGHEAGPLIYYRDF